MADDVAGDTQPQQVGMEALKLCSDYTQILAALGNFNAVDVLNAHCVSKGMGVGADAADALNQNQSLDSVALGGKLFDTAVVIANKNVGFLDVFALGIELCVYGLFQRGMVRPDGNDIAHMSPPPLYSFFSLSSLRGMTMI